MADLPVPKSYEQILSEMLSAYASRVGVNDFNVGGAALSFFEVVALSTARASGDIFQILRDFSVDRATGEALQRLAIENKVTPITAKPSTGSISVTDTSFTKIFTKIYAGANPPNIGSTEIKVSDASQFPASGTVYIGRGTPNVEEVDYSSITPSGGLYIITLSSATQKFHNVGETVVLAQGGVRTIPANTIVRSPGVGANEDITFTVVSQAIILDGETTVDNVQVTALTPGTTGNVPRGAIREFASPPIGLSESVITNDLPFTTGRDTETDDELRVRIKRAIASRGLGTATAIKSAVIGAVPSDEQSTIISSEIINDDSSAVLYIDDGTGYEAKTDGVGLEPIVDQAFGGEQYFQLTTGGRQAPIAKAFLLSTFEAPFDLIGSDTLAVVVGEQTYQHVFSDSDFRSPGGATAYEVAASINANTTIGFEATTSGGGQYVVIRSKTEDSDSLMVTDPTTTGRNAATLLGFPFNQVQTLRLYKNKKFLTKDGKSASVFTTSQQNWASTIAEGDTLTLSVDGTDYITYTLMDADFIATGLANSVSSTAPLEVWVEVLNNKLTGVTASIVGQQIRLTSNLGISNRAQISIDPYSVLVSKGMFTVTMGLSAQGQASDFSLSRNTAQFKLATPLEAGDELSAGSDKTEARIESLEISGGSITLTSDAHVWFLVDSSGEIIPTGVTSNSILDITKPSPNKVRYESGIVNAFANVLVGDYFIVWSEEIDSNNRLEGRVSEVTSSTLTIDVTSAEYSASVPQTGIIFSEGFSVLRSVSAPQKFKVSAGTKTIDQIAAELQAQTSALSFSTLEDKYLVVESQTKNTSGSVLVVTADLEGKLLNFRAGASDTSKESLIAFYESGAKEAQFPLFVHAAFAAGSAANPPDTFINSIVSSLSFSGRDPNELIRIIQPYGSVNDVQPYNEYTQIETISGATLGIDTNPLIRRLRVADRFFIANPLDFGHKDTSVVIADDDTTSKSFEIPFYRRAITNTSLAVNPSNFNAYDVDSGPTTSFAAYFDEFDFSNFKVMMQAKKVLNHSSLEDALLYRSVRWGRSGEKITIGYDYPSSANKALDHTVSVSESVDIRVYLKSGASITTLINATTGWNVTITPNTPVAGVDQVTYTWSGVGAAPALSLSGGEYVNISSQSGFDPANIGIFRVSTEVGFAPTATSFTIQRKTGEAVAESGVLTQVNGSINFYNSSDTTADDINTYVNASIADYITSLIVDDGGTSGSGIINKSTYEDSNFVYDRVQLKDGLNWILSSDTAGSPQFIFKKPLDLSSDTGYNFNEAEELRLVPTTQDQVKRLLSVLAVTGFTTVGTIKTTERGSQLELATKLLGSDGAIQIIGGAANGYEVPIIGTASRLNNTSALVSVDKVAAQDVHSDQWFRLESSVLQRKVINIDSNTSVSVASNSPIAGKSTISFLNRSLNQRYFGQPRHFVRSKGRNFRIEKHGDIACLSWDGNGSSPQFIKSSLNFNDVGGGTINVQTIFGSNDAEYTILTGDANFTELSIGDLITISGLPVSANNGTFLVTGVSDNGKIVRVLNPEAEDEFSNGYFDFSGNVTPVDNFNINNNNLYADVDFAIGVTTLDTQNNLAAALAALPNVSSSVVGSDVIAQSTLSIPQISIFHAGDAAITSKGRFDFSSNCNSGDVFSVGTTDFIAGTSFTIGATILDTATNLAAEINSLPGYTSLAGATDVSVSSTSPNGTVSIIYKGSATITVNGIFTLGANAYEGDAFTVDTTTLITGKDFVVGNTTAESQVNLSLAISAIAGVTSHVDSTYVIVTATSLNATIPISYAGSPVVTVSGALLVGDSFSAGDFSASSEVSEGDSLIIEFPFPELNQGKFRVIRRYQDSVWFENSNAVEQEVSLPLNPAPTGVNLYVDVTTSLKIDSSNNGCYLTWNDLGTEPALGNAKVGDILTLGSDFAVVNQGEFMVKRSGAKLPEITKLTMPSSTQLPTGAGVGKYFLINSAGDAIEYYVWFNNGFNTDPAIVGKTDIEVAFLPGDSAIQIAAKAAIAIGAATGLSATSSAEVVTVTTTDSKETTHASNGDMPSPFGIILFQAGRRTFLECINPSAADEAAVFVSGGTFECHRPQIQFYEYDATVAGDSISVTGDVLTLPNAGTYVVDSVLDKDTVVVTGSLVSVFNVSLNNRETSIFVQEQNVYTGYKRVSLAATQPGAPQRTNLIFDTNAQYNKINESSLTQMSAIGKLSFSTSIKKGLDSYRYNIGLIAEANRIIYGDPRDPTTYPGVGAAGADIYVREPLTRRIQVSIVVRINTGVPFAAIVEQVRTNVSSLINSNPIGQPIAISAIVSTVNSIPGVRAVAISSPQYDSTHDVIYLASSEKARIIDPVLDVSVSSV